jgi:hypothetical protein
VFFLCGHRLYAIIFLSFHPVSAHNFTCRVLKITFLDATYYLSCDRSFFDLGGSVVGGEYCRTVVCGYEVLSEHGNFCV